jgi:hypothetical protein
MIMTKRDHVAIATRLASRTQGRQPERILAVLAVLRRERPPKREDDENLE